MASRSEFAPCPPAPQQFDPTTKVALTEDVVEGELILIDPTNNVQNTKSAAGHSAKRRMYSVGIHKQVKRSGAPNFAVCIDSNSRGNVVSAQRYGVVNFPLGYGISGLQYGAQIFVKDLRSDKRRYVPNTYDNLQIGTVVAIFTNYPSRGETSATVKLSIGQ